MRVFACFPEPKTVAQVRHFLGLASYYRRLIHKFGATVKPLNALTAKCHISVERGVPGCVRVPEAKITQAPILVYPNVDVPFVLKTYASIQGLAAVLLEKNSDNAYIP